ncbi:MAG: LamG-like jellyroll fold domain-containing protein [Planctomycetota bacterium]
MSHLATAAARPTPAPQSRSAQRATQRVLVGFACLAGTLSVAGTSAPSAPQERAPLDLLAALHAEPGGAPEGAPKRTDQAIQGHVEGLRFVPGGVYVDRPTWASVALPKDALRAFQASNEFTLEAWAMPLAPLVEPGLPRPTSSRLVSLGTDGRRRNLALDMTRDGARVELAWWVRTTATTDEGGPIQTTSVDLRERGPHHFALTRSASGVETLYVDGAAVTSVQRPGALASWDLAATLALFGEPDVYRPWRGAVQHLALEPRALDVREVAQRSALGPFRGQTAAARGWLRIEPSRPAALDVGAATLSGDVLTWLDNPGQGPLRWHAELQDAPAWLDLGGASSGTLAPGQRQPLRLIVRHDELAKATVERMQCALVLTTEQHDATASERIVREVRIARDLDADRRPGEHDTGPALIALDERVGGFTVRTTGAVIEGLHVSGPILIDADDVIVRDVVIDGGDARYALRVVNGRRNVRIERAWIKGGRVATCAATGCALSNVRIEAADGVGLLSLGDVTAERCWIEARQGPNAAIAVRRGANTSLFELRIDAAPECAAALAIESTLGSIDGVSLEASWLGGGQYTLAVNDGGFGRPTRIAVSDNYFFDGATQGTVLGGSTEGWHWSGNTFAQSGLPLSLD